MSEIDLVPGPDPQPPKPAPWLGPGVAPGASALVVAAIVFQLAILGWMIGGYALMFRPARVVLLQVEPVDPRDLFRGEYVILGYAFSRVPPEGVAGLPGPYRTDELQSWQGRPVFVPLAPEADGLHYRGGAPTIEPPAAGAYLQGTLEGPSRIDFGIESFYVQEGEGKAYEEAVRRGRLWAEVAVTPGGWGMVRALRIEDDEAGENAMP